MRIHHHERINCEDCCRLGVYYFIVIIIIIIIHPKAFAAFESRVALEFVVVDK